MPFLGVSAPPQAIVQGIARTIMHMTKRAKAAAVLPWSQTLGDRIDVAVQNVRHTVMYAACVALVL